jgi:hypothetical protein
MQNSPQPQLPSNKPVAFWEFGKVSRLHLGLIRKARKESKAGLFLTKKAYLKTVCV